MPGRPTTPLAPCASPVAAASLAASTREVCRTSDAASDRVVRRVIELKSADDVAGIRDAGCVLAEALEAARAACVAGITTSEIDQVIRASIESRGAEALFLGYTGPTGAARVAYPAASCISVNDELVHGVPGSRVLVDGDVVSIDAGVRSNGWCADSAITVFVGEVDPSMHRMRACAEAMLAHATRAIVPGRRWSTIAREIEQLAVDAGFSVAVDFVGHGIGRALHEAPQVPASITRRFVEHDDFTLRPGMVLAIEPMLIDERPQRNVAGDLLSPKCTLQTDGWTVRVDSGARSCHVEHTVVVTRNGAEVLTWPTVAPRVSSSVSPSVVSAAHESVVEACAA